MATRYRCNACGNLTRFDVLASRRTRAFHHYSIGGELTVEEEDVLEDRVEQVTCRWCGASGDAIERLPIDVGTIEVPADVLRELDAVDVPSSLRQLHGFDRRGLLAGPGPRQLRRALVNDAAF